MPFGERLHERCACSGAAAPFSVAGSRSHYERSRPFAIVHLDLDLELLMKSRSVRGTARLSFERVDPSASQLRLDAVGFEIERVRVDVGQGFVPAEHVYDGECLEVRIARSRRRGRVEVRYRTRPQRGLYFLMPDADHPKRPTQVWSQCQDEDARHWFPCIDKPHMKMTTSLRVQVPAGLTALSNGELVRKATPRRGRWSYQFQMSEPHPSYLVTLVVGRFEAIADRDAVASDGRGIPVVYFVPPGRKQDTVRSLGETPNMIELFGRLTGVDFPWSRYSQIVVSDFIFGGMENTTATTLYEHVLLDARAALDATSNDLVAHELAHQWFGDYVTCRDWSHAWLNEGFATFFEHVERESRLGLDEYEFGVNSDLLTYLEEASDRYQRPLVCRDYAYPIELFDRHLYEKGGLVLHMLRRELGDSVFWRGVHEYLVRGRNRIVETNDLRRALEDVSGVSLERFFDQWVYRAGHPTLKVEMVWDNGRLDVQVRQTQKRADVPYFELPFEIEVAPKRGTPRRFRKRVDSARDVLSVRLSERPKWVTFDPEFRIAGGVSVEAPADMQRAQLRAGTTARARWSAAGALGGRSDLATIDALASCLADRGECWMVRARAATALGRIRASEARDHLTKNAETEHPKVRRAVATALGELLDAAPVALLAQMARRDPSYLVQAAAARALGRTRQPEALRTLIQISKRSSWADVCRAGALAGMGTLGDERALPQVLELTRPSTPARGRRAAIATLAELSDSRVTRRHLERLLDDDDPHVRVAAGQALRTLGDPRCSAALHQRLSRERDGRVYRQLRETLRELGDGGSQERRRLHDELEQVRGELGELKARLAKLEGSRSKPRSRSRPAGSAGARVKRGAGT